MISNGSSSNVIKKTLSRPFLPSRQVPDENVSPAKVRLSSDIFDYIEKNRFGLARDFLIEEPGFINLSKKNEKNTLVIIAVLDQIKKLSEPIQKIFPYKVESACKLVYFIIGSQDFNFQLTDRDRNTVLHLSIAFALEAKDSVSKLFIDITKNIFIELIKEKSIKKILEIKNKDDKTFLDLLLSKGEKQEASLNERKKIILDEITNAVKIFYPQNLKDEFLEFYPLLFDRTIASEKLTIASEDVHAQEQSLYQQIMLQLVTATHGLKETIEQSIKNTPSTLVDHQKIPCLFILDLMTQFMTDALKGEMDEKTIVFAYSLIDASLNIQKMSLSERLMSSSKYHKCLQEVIDLEGDYKDLKVFLKNKTKIEFDSHEIKGLDDINDLAALKTTKELIKDDKGKKRFSIKG